MRHGFEIPCGIFGLCGRHEDFDRAEAELGPIPRHRRVVIINGLEYHFYRVPSPHNDRWPTTGQFLKFNIRVLASGSMVTSEEETNKNRKV